MQDTEYFYKIPEARQVKQSQDKYFTSQNNYLWIHPAGNIKNIYSGSFDIFKTRISSGFQYIPQFSLYSHATETNNARLVNLFEVIEIMRSEKLRCKASDIREAQEIGDTALKMKLKKSLPYITHTGVFIPRQNAGLQMPGFTFQLDIDKINDPDKLLDRIKKDRQLHILFACKSVSGNGIKAMLFLNDLLFLRTTWTHEQYRQTYHNATDILYDYFKDRYGIEIDTQMKAISQPFFLFYSPELFINKNLQPWT